MKTSFSLVTLALFAASALSAHADGKSEIKDAAKKLADKPNYSWVATSKFEGGGGGGGNFRMGPTEGKLEKGGWIHTSSSFNDTKIETVIKGTKGAMKRDEDWKTTEELEGDDRGAFMARRIKNFKAPAVEAEELADTVKELKKGDDGTYSGELTQDGAKALFARGGRRPSGGDGPADAKGSAKFWIKDGVLSKFEYNLQGTIKRRDSDEEIKSNRTTTFEIKDVGTTTVTVPAEAKKKLS